MRSPQQDSFLNESIYEVAITEADEPENTNESAKADKKARQNLRDSREVAASSCTRLNTSASNNLTTQGAEVSSVQVESR